MADDTTRTVKLRICAPIPVGHEVTVHFFEKDTAVFSTKFELDEEQPAVVDRTTGIVYGAKWHPPGVYGWQEPIEAQYTKTRSGTHFDGVVRGCAVMVENGSEGDRILTVLTIEEGATTYR